MLEMLNAMKGNVHHIFESTCSKDDFFNSLFHNVHSAF